MLRWRRPVVEVGSRKIQEDKNYQLVLLSDLDNAKNSKQLKTAFLQRQSNKLITFHQNYTISAIFQVTEMSKLVKRGALIVFEGCDRSGKTTQCKKLVDALNEDGHKAQFMRFPGKIIRCVVLRPDSVNEKGSKLYLSVVCLMVLERARWVG